MTVGAVFFDLFGTLLPLGPLDDACDALAPGRGREIAARWRARQIEASWLRTITGRWADFDAITIEALRATLDELDVVSDDTAVGDVATAFATLPLDARAAVGIERLRAGGVALGVLTNASAATLAAVAARLELPFDHLLSVDAVRRFKPDPAVYRLAVAATGIAPERIGFVTANGWDAAGAGAFGFRVAWLARASRAGLPAIGAPPPLDVSWTDVPAVFLGSRIAPRPGTG